MKNRTELATPVREPGSPSPWSDRQHPTDEQGRLEFAALRAHESVVSSSWAEKARYLQELFGQRLAAAITGVDDARTVGRWIRGQEPQHAQRQRLRDAYQIAILLETAESREVAKSWFLGMNPMLNDELPAQVIAEDAQNGGNRVMKAARTFLAS
jgi:hypothetical protein